VCEQLLWMGGVPPRQTANACGVGGRKARKETASVRKSLAARGRPRFSRSLGEENAAYMKGRGLGKKGGTKLEAKEKKQLPSPDFSRSAPIRTRGGIMISRHKGKLTAACEAGRSQKLAGRARRRLNRSQKNEKGGASPRLLSNAGKRLRGLGELRFGTWEKKGKEPRAEGQEEAWNGGLPLL